ncbi:MAG: MaoC/PaaZ C-terminal domain-containing protein [Anaerolineales bacterium]
MPSIQRGLYFEDFTIGQTITTTARTITETDIVSFAGLSGDYNQIHTDAEYAKTTPFGQRISHGILTLSVVSGLAVQTGFMEGTIIAFREINEWKFSKPVFIGDTVHATLEIIETKPMRRLGGGAIVIKLNVFNQHHEVVMSGTWTALMASKP